jgi:hypothetical protein
MPQLHGFEEWFIDQAITRNHTEQVKNFDRSHCYFLEDFLREKKISFSKVPF